ncbi:unnamed protein product [Linum tenue]|uniref:Uncharacterized protein n=2 Tax=Linum tenue TaxID=586396 RepID=A0AAV0LP13_9ROSI|nr:unnamed protein product [Linum tenue]
MAGSFLRTDSQLIVAELKRKDRLLKLKRRCLPESMLREDDVFYDSVKTFVEQAFGVHHVEREVKTTCQFLNVNNIEGILLSCLDSLTTKGLYLVSMFLTKGVQKFEKTRKKMRNVIQKSIPGFLRNLNSKDDKECCSHYFQWNVAAIKLLDRLKDLPTEALFAMRRKLRGLPAELPCLQKRRHGWSRDTLICKVKRTIRKMLSELVGSGRHSFQEPLTMALAVAGLSLKLKRCPGSCMTDFIKFSPEIELLQTEIIKAIWLLETKVRMPELQALQHLLDPCANIPARSLRTAMKKLFTEYLFDCNELDFIPKGFLKALNLTNRSSRVSPDGYLMTHVIEEEAESIISVSSDIKQLVWDLIPGYGLAENFGDAYAEEPCGSEDDDCGDVSPKQQEFDSPSFRFGSMYSENDEESFAEYTPLDVELDIPNPDQEGQSLPSTHNDCKIGNPSLSMVLKVECDMKAESYQSNANSLRNASGFHELNLCSRGEESGPSNQTLCNNLYLDVQEASDETSLVAYNLIGSLLAEFTLEDRLDLDYTDGYLRGNYSYQRDAGIEVFSFLFERWSGKTEGADGHLKIAWYSPEQPRMICQYFGYVDEAHLLLPICAWLRMTGRELKACRLGMTGNGYLSSSFPMRLWSALVLGLIREIGLAPSLVSGDTPLFRNVIDKEFLDGLFSRELQIITSVSGAYRSIKHRATVNSEMEMLSIACFHSPKYDGEIGLAASMITEETPAVFKKVTIREFYNGLFSRQLDSKAYIDTLKIQQKENH